MHLLHTKQILSLITDHFNIPLTINIIRRKQLYYIIYYMNILYLLASIIMNFLSWKFKCCSYASA